MAVGTENITFNYECGNGQNLVENGANDFSFDCIKTYQPNGGFWFGVSIINGAYISETVTLEVNDLDLPNFTESWFPQPVYRYNDGSDWIRITGATYDDTNKKMDFTIGPFGDAGTIVAIHINPPWLYTEFQTWLSGLSGDHFSYETLGTIDGRNLELLTISSPNGSWRKKKNIWITALQHPGEVWAGWAAKGLVDFLLGNTAMAAMLREKYLWKIIPMFNPDGVYNGNGYHNSEGYNTFEDWANKNTTNVTLVDAAITDWGVTPDMFLDFHCAQSTAAHNRLHINDAVDANTGFEIRQMSIRLAEFLIRRTRMTATNDVSRSGDGSYANYMYNTKGVKNGLIVEFCFSDPNYSRWQQAYEEGRNLALAAHDYFGGSSARSKLVA